MRLVTKTITPEWAKKALQNNPRNRNLRESRVAAYANAMKKGEWTYSPSPISFDKEGHLLDGQHRLHGVIRSGVYVPMVIAYDVDSDAVFDKGAERRTGDSLYMRGIISKEMSSYVVTALVKMYLQFALSKQAGQISDTMIAEFINKHETEIKEILVASRHGESKSYGRICSRAGIQAALLGALLNDIPLSIIRRFAYVANSGFSDSTFESSAIVLRNEIMGSKLTGNGKMVHLCKVAQSALNDFYNRTPRRQLYKNAKNIYIKEETL